ncbi:unnamed protein product [Cercopithifilaria johnstoni]|uniref:Uncharacterized protein n=1 Tax=Cercopithifilaria johnstoni TaxID=2874296 RepID=A0A8J2M276_9BILA|nr:unnamed protein product [Cercopithifilaria johnstoni]
MLRFKVARRLKRVPPKFSNFSNSFSSTNKVDNKRAHLVEQQAQISPPPLSDIPSFQLRNQQFVTGNGDIPGIIIQHQWTTPKNLSYIDNNSKNKSVMSAKVETTIRQWSTPIEKVVEGQPPRPVSHRFKLICFCDKLNLIFG